MNLTFALIRGTTGKVLFISALTLVLLLPLGMIRDLIEEREAMRELAETDVSQAWGGPQTIGGPIVVLPIESRSDRAVGGSAVTREELYILPEQVSIVGDATTTILERGIYDVPVYAAALSISGLLRPPGLDPAPPDTVVLRWDQAVLALLLSDARSVTDRVTIAVGGATAEFGPGGERGRDRLIVPLSELGLEGFETSQEFSIELRLGGVESLRFLPLGDVTTVELGSTWPTPSFQGSHLPVARDVSASGFDAAWRVLALGRGFPASFRGSTAAFEGGAGFGVDFLPPLSVHAASLKASKYGVLFVGLSFVAFFLFEIFRRLRLHPMHYLSVGMANVTFYLLLLAIAEHIGFAPSYLLSATASTLLISGYAAAILDGFGRSIPIAALLIVTYSQLYVILKAEDYAVLIGSLTLFALLAGFMYLTRHVDWYALDPGQRVATRAGSVPLGSDADVS